MAWTMPQIIADCFLSSNGPLFGKMGEVLWRMIVQAVCWTIWLERNRRIFEDKEETVVETWAKLNFMLAWWIVNHKIVRVFFFV